MNRVLAALIGLAWLLVVRWTPALGLELALAVGLLAPLAWLWRRARRAIDASASLRERAAQVAKLFPAAFVVMGHTHLPEISKRREGVATYVNVGGWAEEETTDSSIGLSASRTHLVVEPGESRPEALLLSWDAEQGPLRFDSIER